MLLEELFHDSFTMIYRGYHIAEATTSYHILFWQLIPVKFLNTGIRPSPFFSPFRVVWPTQILGIFPPPPQKKLTTFLSHFYVAQEFWWLILFPTLS